METFCLNSWNIIPLRLFVVGLLKQELYSLDLEHLYVLKGERKTRTMERKLILYSYYETENTPFNQIVSHRPSFTK